MKFKFHKYKNCKTCLGYGYTLTEEVAGFDTSSMEVFRDEKKDLCPDCMERSEYEYDLYQESKDERNNDY